MTHKNTPSDITQDVLNAILPQIKSGKTELTFEHIHSAPYIQKQSIIEAIQKQGFECYFQQTRAKNHDAQPWELRYWINREHITTYKIRPIS